MRDISRAKELKKFWADYLTAKAVVENCSREVCKDHNFEVPHDWPTESKYEEAMKLLRNAAWAREMDSTLSTNTEDGK